MEGGREGERERRRYLRSRDLRNIKELTIQHTIKQNKNEDDIGLILEHPRMAGRKIVPGQRRLYSHWRKELGKTG